MADSERTELVAILEQAFFTTDPMTGLEYAVEAVNALLANPDVVLRALGITTYTDADGVLHEGGWD